MSVGDPGSILGHNLMIVPKERVVWEPQASAKFVSCTHMRKNYEVRWHAVDHEEPCPNVRDRRRDRTSHGDSGTWPTFLFKRSMSRCRISTAFPDLNISRISPTFMGKCLILHYLSWKRTVANDRQSHRLWSYHGDLGTWFTTFLLWRQQVRVFVAEYDLFICAISISGG